MLNKSVSSFRRSVTTLLTAAMTQRNKRMKSSSLHSIPLVLSLLTSYNRGNIWTIQQGRDHLVAQKVILGLVKQRVQQQDGQPRLPLFFNKLGINS